MIQAHRINDAIAQPVLSALDHPGPKAQPFPATLPKELIRHIYRVSTVINDDANAGVSTSASGMVEAGLELFLELSLDDNERLLKRCLRHAVTETRRKMFSLPPDLIRRVERRCYELNHERHGSLKVSSIAEASVIYLIERDLEGVVQCLKRFNVSRRRK